MWSPKYKLEKCNECETTERKHFGNGLCVRCFGCKKRNSLDFRHEEYACPVCGDMFLSITNTHMKKHPRFFEQRIPIEKLAKILGHMIGDGGINKSKTGFIMHYTNTSEHLLNRLINEVKSLFGEMKIYKRLKSDEYHKVDCFDIIFPGYIANYFIKNFGDIFTSTRKRIPIEISKASDEAKISFLQALFDDEGTANPVSGQITINVNKGNKLLALSIYDLLQSLNINCCLPSDYSRKSRKDWSWRITISRAYEYDKIGFSHPEKSNKLIELLKTRNMSKQCKICSTPLFEQGDAYHPTKKYCKPCAKEELLKRNRLYSNPALIAET